MARILTMLGVLLLMGCSQNMYMEGRRMLDRGEYDRVVGLYEEEIRNNPESAEAWRELGVALYKKGNLSRAESALKQSNDISKTARTYLYLGLVYEKQEMYDEALAAYRISLGLKPARSVKDKITGHLDNLISKKLNREVSLALQNEADISVDTIPENSIGVVDFDDSQLPPELAPISKGLAELTSIDLAKVNSLRVVDRLKIDMILSELKLSSSQYADPKVGPRLGRLMGSNRLVSGIMTGIGENEIRLDGAVIKTADSSAITTEPTQGELEQFFEIQKDFVFKLIEDLGISLTTAERDEIQKVPTESYLAFLAYSRGLDFRGRGMYDEAIQEFNAAINADKNFGAAREQGRAVSQISSTAKGGLTTFEQYEASVTSASDKSEETASLETLQSSILSNSGFIGDSQIYLPPRPTPVYNTGTVIIRGNLDAEP